MSHNRDNLTSDLYKSLFLSKKQHLLFYYLLIFVLFAAAYRYVKFLRIDCLPRNTMLIAFCLKTLVGAYFIFIYTQYYGSGTLSADAGQFMEESHLLFNVFRQDPQVYFKLLLGIENSQEVIHHYLGETSHWDVTQNFINDNRNILRFHSLIQFISFNHVFVHVIIVCALSLLSVKQLFLAFRPYTQVKDSWLFWTLFLIPSILFWTSGILKEPFMFLGLAFILRSLLDKNLGNKKRLPLMLAGIILLLTFKLYILFALIPAVLIFLIHRSLPKYKTSLSILVGVLFAVLVFGLSEQLRNGLSSHLSRKQFDFINVARGGVHAYTDSCFYLFMPEDFSKLEIDSQFVCVREQTKAYRIEYGTVDHPKEVVLEPTDSALINYFQNEQCVGYIETTRINHSFHQLLLNIPEALINSLFRPFWFDPGGIYTIPAIIEINLIWILLILSLIFRRKINVTEQGLVLASVVFIVLLGLLIGWVTPVLGAIVRYRIPILAAVYLLIVIFIKAPKHIRKNE